MTIIFMSLAFCAGMLTMGFLQCGTKAAIDEDHSEPGDPTPED